MSVRRASLWPFLALALSAGAPTALAQSPPITVEPTTAGAGAALVISADESALASNEAPAQSITFALPRGARFDRSSRETLCERAQAARGACPDASRIGSGRFVVAVRRWLLGTGEAQLAWSLDAFLGKPLVRGDAASVVLTGNLLGAGNVAALLAPALSSTIPNTARAVGRVIERRSGRYGVELRFADLPVNIDVPEPISAAPVRMEIALSAVRRTRENFFRRFRVRTPSGYEVRKVRDHRLIGHHLLRNPRSCRDTWPAELRTVFAGVEKRTRSTILCSTAD